MESLIQLVMMLSSQIIFAMSFSWRAVFSFQYQVESEKECVPKEDDGGGWAVVEGIKGTGQMIR
ncbi:MAG: hypothetical protein J6X74_03195 [Bacteroidaceae bacterium]|nr:hypothetical protein [Bacteroidaceae bacterium]